MIDHRAGLQGILKSNQIMKASNVHYSPFEASLQTGLKRLDLRLNNGGLLPSFTMISGGEKGGKTTIITHIIHEALREGIPVAYFDYESSFNHEYAARFTRSNSTLEELLQSFDVAMPANGNEFFDAVEQLVYHHLPNKKKMLIGKKPQWYLLYSKTQAKKQKIKGKPLEGFVTTPATDGKPQYVIIVDSLASMAPATQHDEKEDRRMAIDASMFKKGLPMIKAPLINAHCILLGINQIRDNPGATFGPTRYDPGGNALQHYTDVKIWVSSVSVPPEQRAWGRPDEDGKPVSSGPKYYEWSISGGLEQYKFSKIEIKKNKKGFAEVSSFTPRMCVFPDFTGGQGFGFDIIHDMLFFCKDLNMIEGNGKNFKINIRAYQDNSGWHYYPPEWQPFYFNEVPMNIEQLKWLLLCPDESIVNEMCKGFGIQGPHRVRGERSLEAYLARLAKSPISTEMFSNAILDKQRSINRSRISFGGDEADEYIEPDN